jgi:DNA gyrase subunit A
MEFKNIRRNGLIGITLRDDDELIEVKTTDSDTHIFIVTKKGMCIRFKETEARPLGRAAMGVMGIDLDDDDEVVGMQLDHQGDSLLIVSENGIGKRSELSEFKIQHRGGKGLKCYKITEKTGEVIGVKAVNDDHEIMMITTAGTIIQVRMSEVPVHGRITSGVKLMNVEKGVTVAQIAKVREDIKDAEVATEQEENASEEIVSEEGSVNTEESENND